MTWSIRKQSENEKPLLQTTACQTAARVDTVTQHFLNPSTFWFYFTKEN